MLYRVERSYITDEHGRYAEQRERSLHKLESESAAHAAEEFIRRDNAVILGEAGELPGDKATATADCEGRVYVIFVQRDEEASPSGGN